MNRLSFESRTGWAATGQLLIRLASSTALIWDALPYARLSAQSSLSVLHLLAAVTGGFLAAGYRAQWMGGLTAAIEISLSVFAPGKTLTHILLAAFAAGVALEGAGPWSIDARLAGWQKIDIPPRPPDND